MQREAGEPSPQPSPPQGRGSKNHQLFFKTVTQADQGVDFDFLRAAEITQTVPRSA